MALQLGRAVSDGVKRILTPTGAVLLVVLFALQLLVQSSINTAIVDAFPPGPAGELEAAFGLTLPVSGTVASALALLAYLLITGFLVALSRALVRPRSELSSFPASLYTRRIGRATLAMLVAGILVGVAVTVGLVLFVLPGIFLAASLMFYIFAIGVEDRGVVSGLQRSWALAGGNRLKLVALVILSAVVGGVVGGVAAVFELSGAPVVAELISNAISSLLFTFLYGIMAAAYLQVRDDAGGSGAAGTPGSATSSELYGG